MESRCRGGSNGLGCASRCRLECLRACGRLELNLWAGIRNLELTAHKWRVGLKVGRTFASNAHVLIICSCKWLIVKEVL
jgi:hypothetical protein